MVQRRYRSATIVLVIATLSGCAPAPPPAMPPPLVDTVTVSLTPVRNFVNLPGRVEAVRTADVRARVDGVVQRRVFTEGSDVSADQTLFRIDPRERQADYQAALATLERAKASELNAEQVAARYRPLVAQQAISQQEYDAAVAQQRTAQADVSNARAMVDRARLALSYTTVTAPISGRVGRAQVTEGALVSAAGATLMTRIEQLDPIYIDFSQSSRDILDIRRKILSGAIRLPNLNEVGVSLTLEDGTPFGAPGRLNFANMDVDQSTGTVSLRAQFPNHARLLLPGQFVRARIDAGLDPTGIKVPQRAVLITQSGAAVMVVGGGEKAELRPIKLGPLDGGDWVVASGLKAGDRVIVGGLQKVRPGLAVRVGPPGPTDAGVARRSVSTAALAKN